MLSLPVGDVELGALIGQRQSQKTVGRSLVGNHSIRVCVRIIRRQRNRQLLDVIVPNQRRSSEPHVGEFPRWVVEIEQRIGHWPSTSSLILPVGGLRAKDTRLQRNNTERPNRPQNSVGKTCSKLINKQSALKGARLFMLMVFFLLNEISLLSITNAYLTIVEMSEGGGCASS